MGKMKAKIKAMKDFFALKRVKKDKKGFTLIEMLIVLAIIGVLIALIIPSSNTVDTAKVQSTANTISQLYNAARMCVLNNGDTNYENCKTIASVKSYLPSSVVSGDKVYDAWGSEISIDVDNNNNNVLKITDSLDKVPSDVRSQICSGITNALKRKAYSVSCDNATYSATILFH